MKIIGLALLGILLIYVLTLNKKKLQNHVEKLSIFWFRLAFAFLVLSECFHAEALIIRY